MDIWQRMKDVAHNVKDHGYHIQHRMISDLDIEWYQRQIEELKSGYSEMAVDQKIYRKRENTEGRLGDALIVSLSEPDLAPYRLIDGGIASLYLTYIHTLGYFLGENVKDDTKVLFNYQFYKEGASNSLPFHFDAEIFKGDWTKEYIELKEGLIPRMVMVVVLENDNDGRGLQLMTKEGKIVNINMVPGDIIYFDNTSVLHGVPDDLPNKRSMMGFRSFETKPLYFNEKGIDDKEYMHKDIIEIDTQYVKGQAVELTTAEAKQKLIDEGWYF